MRESKSYANYTIIAFLLFYALIQFISALMLGLPNSLSTYFTFSFTLLYALYFCNVRQVFSWVLAIIAPPIIFYLVIVLVSNYFGDYTAKYDFRFLFMVMLPLSACIFIFYFIRDWITKKQNSNGIRFIKISSFVHFITMAFYGAILFFFTGLMTLSSHNTYSDVIAAYLLIFTYLLLPLPLAIYAHINKRHIEKYFHLLYMVFAPILPFIPVDIGDYPTIETSKNAADAFFNTSIAIVVSIPLLFVLRNYYLWYRRYRQERKDLRKNGG